MNPKFPCSPITICASATQIVLADIQPYRPNWDELEANSGNSSVGLFIVAGMFFSAAVLLAVVMRRRSPKKGSKADVTEVGGDDLQPKNKGSQSRG